MCRCSLWLKSVGALRVSRLPMSTPKVLCGFPVANDHAGDVANHVPLGEHCWLMND